MDGEGQAIFEEVRLSALRERARKREHELDQRVLWAIDLWEQRTRQSFHRYAAEKLTSDKEHPVAETTIYDMLARRNGRRPWWCLVELLFEEVPEFNAWANERNGWEEPKRKLVCNGDSLARAYEDKLREFGPNGERAIAEGREQARQAAQRERDVNPPPIPKKGQS